MPRTYEIRDPIHGFVVLNEWERDIINHPVFQRLRRIRQLGWTEMVYPGAMHTRFEHSLGVMDVATRMFDQVVLRRRELLCSELAYTGGGLEKDRVLVRLAGLLHDVGHAPFSHAAEELMPEDPDTGRPFKHEHYSAAAIVHLMRDVIEDHPLNQNYGIKAQDIADFLNGRASLGRAILWRGLISGQLDADRADYLLRDSHHIGVAYGRYDLHRLLATMTVAMDPESSAATLAVEDGGSHAAEALILARYLMFTQVYFQHTRRAFDHHIAEAVSSLLQSKAGDAGKAGKGTFPAPTDRQSIEDYVAWTDWRVLGLLDEGGGGEHGRILRERRHYRRAYETPEVPTAEDLQSAEEVAEALTADTGEAVFIDTAKNSWYKFGGEDIRILRASAEGEERLLPLSQLSSVVQGLRANNQVRIYVSFDRKDEARREVERLRRREEPT